jgi:hypothetical protein
VGCFFALSNLHKAPGIQLLKTTIVRTVCAAKATVDVRISHKKNEMWYGFVIEREPSGSLQMTGGEHEKT